MASINLSGVLRDPLGDVSYKNKFRFTHNTTTGETVKGFRSSVTVEVNGEYDFDVEYGNVHIESMDFNTGLWIDQGVITINSDTAATSIPALLGITTPATDADLLVFQALVADAELARDESLAAKDDVLSRISSHEVESTEYLINTFDSSALAVGDAVKTIQFSDGSLGGKSTWVKSSATGVASKTPAELGELSLTTVNGDVFDFYGSTVSGGQVGFSNSTDNFEVAVAVMKTFSDNNGGTLNLEEDGNYLISGLVKVGDNVTINNKSKLRVGATSTGMFDFTGSYKSKLLGGYISCSNSTSSTPVIHLDDAEECKVKYVDFSEATGSSRGTIAIGGSAKGNDVSFNKTTSSKATFIVLDGSSKKNIINFNDISDSVGFGVKLTGTTSKNDVIGNHTESNGIELVGITNLSHSNKILGNSAEGTGDNGISISGYNNTVIGNICNNNEKAGIWVWGSRNTVTGNNCWDNNQEGTLWAGVGVSANYGGTGQLNSISGNTCGNTIDGVGNFNSFRIAGGSYDEWASNTTYTKGSGGTYIVSGLNIYIMLTSGTVTSGSSAPVHTTGTVSDGAIEWRFVNSFYEEANSTGNTVVGNTSGLSVDVAYQDLSGGFNSVLPDRGDSVPFIKKGILSIGSYDSITLLMAENTAKARLTVSDFRPEADLGLKLGLSNRRFSEAYSEKFYIGAGVFISSGEGDPEGVVAASVGSMYTRTDGLAGSTLYIKEANNSVFGWVAK